MGGEDHKTGQVDDAEARMRYWNVGPGASSHVGGSRVPLVGSGNGDDRRPGVHRRGPGRQHDVFIATGDSGMGMTHGTIAGILLTDLICGRESPWANIYDPWRQPLGAAGDFLRENLNTAGQYLDWITAGGIGSIDEIGLDQGAIVRRGLAKVAVYRDEYGGLHGCLAVCRHLGCIVRWNSSERTWGCPLAPWVAV